MLCFILAIFSYWFSSAIINHFTPKIDSWAAVNHQASLTPEQVLEVIRSNYDTLTLKLQDNLDHYNKYSEQPCEANFFTQLVSSLWQVFPSCFCVKKRLSTFLYKCKMSIGNHDFESNFWLICMSDIWVKSPKFHKPTGRVQFGLFNITSVISH